MVTRKGEWEIGAVSGRVAMYGITYHPYVQKLFEFTKANLISLGQPSNFSWDEPNSNLGRLKIS